MSVNYYINNPDILADDLSLHDMRKQLLSEAAIQNEHNGVKRRNEFKIQCVSHGDTADISTAGSTQVAATAARWRVEGLNDNILMTPFRKGYTTKQLGILNSMHDRGVGSPPFNRTSGESGPVYGATTSGHYSEESPDFMGRMRDLRFDYSSNKFDESFIVVQPTDTPNKLTNPILMSQYQKSNIPVDELISKIDKELVVIFGDSQMQGSTTGGYTIGRTLQEQFKTAYRRGNQSWTAETWLYGTKDGKPYPKETPQKYKEEQAKVKKRLTRSPALVIIGLGGNGVSSGGKYEKELLTWVKTSAPTASIIWIGPPPPASDGSKKGRMDSRRKLNETLESSIGPLVEKFVNSYKVSYTSVDGKKIDFNNGYACGGKCDGIHIPGNFAKSLLDGAGLLKKK